MHLLGDGRFVRTDIWREGAYLDLWSVPHFLSGIALGFALYFLHFAFNAAVTIALLLLVAYEMFEVIARIEETRANRILDVVVGLSSCIPTLIYAPALPSERALWLFGCILLADCILSFLGWRASHKAAMLETALRAEWEKERTKFNARRTTLAARIRHQD
jgi:hypothetical protein